MDDKVLMVRKHKDHWHILLDAVAMAGLSYMCDDWTKATEDEDEFEDNLDQLLFQVAHVVASTVIEANMIEAALALGRLTEMAQARRKVEEN